VQKNPPPTRNNPPKEKRKNKGKKGGAGISLFALTKLSMPMDRPRRYERRNGL